MNRQRIANGLLTAALFLLPWQTILLYRMVSLPEGATVYGNLGVYVVEILIALAFFFRGRLVTHVAYKNVIQAVYLFIAACFLSLTFSRVFPVSLGWLSHIIAGGMFFLLLLDERTNTEHIIRAFLAGLVLPCLLGWVQYFTGFNPSFTLLGLAEKHAATPGVAVVATDAFRSLRAYGPFPHPNIFGGYLAIAIVLKGWKGRTGLKGLKSWRGWAQIAMITLFTSTLILTFSRGAWLALTIGLVAFLGQALFYKKLVPHRAIPLLSVGLLSIVLSIGMFHSHIFARFNPALHVEATSLYERTSQYKTVGSVLAISPLTGVGPGVYVFALESLSPGQPPWTYQPMHNTFLLLLAELGILGLLAFSYFLFEILRLVSPLLTKPCLPAGREGARGRSTERVSLRSTTGSIFASTLLIELSILATFDHYLLSLWPGIALTAIVFAVSLRFASKKTA